jgi:aconitate hydratase
MLALTFANPADYDKVRQDDRVSILGFDKFAPGKPLQIRLDHADGKSETFDALHTYNEQQIEWVQAGSALNKIRKDFGVK